MFQNGFRTFSVSMAGSDCTFQLMIEIALRLLRFYYQMKGSNKDILSTVLGKVADVAAIPTKKHQKPVTRQAPQRKS